MPTSPKNSNTMWRHQQPLALLYQAPIPHALPLPLRQGGNPIWCFLWVWKIILNIHNREWILHLRVHKLLLLLGLDLLLQLNPCSPKLLVYIVVFYDVAWRCIAKCGINGRQVNGFHNMRLMQIASHTIASWHRCTQYHSSVPLTT